MAQILTQARLATTVNIPLTTNLDISPDDRIDGVPVVIGDRILVKAQSNKLENGVYVITVVSTHYRLIRASDFAAASSQTPGTIIFIAEGNSFADTGWILSTNGTITVGSTPIEFAKFSVNLTPIGSSIGSSITYRGEKGYPLTITELDNNFRYITDNLVTKLNIVDFNSISVRDKINALTAEEANLNSWKLRGYVPSFSADVNSIALRDAYSDIYANDFHGDLIGKADFAGVADSAILAHNFDGMIEIQHGGTNAATAAGARTNLAVVHIGGDTPMSGKLTLAQSGALGASLNMPPKSDASSVINISNGDIWTNSTNILYRLNNLTQTVAPLNAPVFTGGAQFDSDISINSNSISLANTAYVWKHRTEINAALALKSPIDSPTFTGIPAAPTVNVTDGTNEAGTTKIATTAYVVNRINRTLLSYYTAAVTDTQINNAVSPLAPKVSPTFTGTPVAPTAATTTNNTQIATTEYVVSRIASDLGVYSTTAQMNVAITNATSGKANTADFNAALALKANTTDVNAALALKANITYVDTSIANAIAGKAIAANVDAALAYKANLTDLSPYATNAYVDALQSMWGSSNKYVQSTQPVGVDGDFWFKI